MTPQTLPSVHQINRNSDHPTESEQVGEAIDDDETMVDLIATDAFDENCQKQIGYFGPWSNHAIFQFISASFWRVSTHYTSTDLDSSLKDRLSEPHSRVKPPDSLELSRKRPLPRTPNEKCSLPSKSDGVRLLHRFFDSAGVMLAYLNREDIVKRYENARNSNPPRFSRVFLILLNIVWAHASSSFGDARSEIFYHRAMGLLNLHTLQGSSHDLVQSLLLFALYQQNHQRSISSYTTHALCVKTAFQMGFHVLDNANRTEEEYRSRQQLWAAVVNNDRVFSSTLGRPTMISEALLTVEWNQIPDSNMGLSSYLLIYQTRLNSILADATESFSTGTYTKLGHLTVSEVICKRHRLFDKLEQWRDHLNPFGGLVSPVSLTDGISTSETSIAIRVTLSISYYRVCMAINFPLIVSLLHALLHDETKDWQLQHLRQNSHQAIQHDWVAITNLHQIMQSIHSSGDGFVKVYAAHYMCNYTIFTATLHLFAILLIIKRDSVPDMPIAANPTNARRISFHNGDF
ncbi:hypothetical protein AOR_1_152124 [Paecilomyces variotii No. 5]|uniref:Xylanolytic transcriptional activator regulatory domain-containing protein n=1 Tax=Byssochlamys spectabilis (strain No. 5 / NBRC 109023) TaxID=1356009 RepID=V5FEW4_BYSSN|nr:hypothetical protein AOR_1_152124 [Paecilomyces variotii No. 5]